VFIEGSAGDQLNEAVAASDEPVLVSLHCMCSIDSLVVDYTANSGAHTGFHESGHALFGADVVHAPSFHQVEVIVADPLDGCMGGADGAAAAEVDITGNFVAGGMDGKIALIRRGVCYFTTKTINAQNAGAVGAIIYNDDRAGTVVMSGPEVGVTIPAVFIEGSAGDQLNEAVAASDEPVLVSLHCGTTPLNPPRGWTG
jgi:hypothetical protein